MISLLELSRYKISSKNKEADAPVKEPSNWQGTNRHKRVLLFSPKYNFSLLSNDFVLAQKVKPNKQTKPKHHQSVMLSGITVHRATIAHLLLESCMFTTLTVNKAALLLVSMMRWEPGLCFFMVVNGLMVREQGHRVEHKVGCSSTGIIFCGFTVVKYYL